MPVNFTTTSITIPSGTGRRSLKERVRFGSRVIRASAALNGFQLDYVNSDHHINVVEADVDVVPNDPPPDPNTVTVRVQCDYADKNSDDSYRGYVSVLIIAEVA